MSSHRSSVNTQITTENRRADPAGRDTGTFWGRSRSSLMAPPGCEEECRERSDWSDDDRPGVHSAMSRRAGGAAMSTSCGRLGTYVIPAEGPALGQDQELVHGEAERPGPESAGQFQVGVAAGRL